MKRYIPEQIIDEIRSASDIVDIVSDSVRLKQQGSNFVGLCPFHNEKTPSFMVNREKQIFRCFGCGEGGNVFSYVMKRYNLNFPEAARFLAEKAGIAIPETEDPQRNAEMEKRERLYKINELARSFYQHVLLNHESAKAARAYLDDRGITPETISKFQLGYAPPYWDGILQFFKKKGYPEAELDKLGLILPRTKGTPGYYDRFRNRVMFPICNTQGKVIGFGGRVLDDSLPKYLNSPETVLFNKGHNLFGLNKAIESIRQKDQIIIVEGYLDVITCHQAGITNVVASLGTALTREQGKLLLRYTREVIMAYDTDAAGIKATIKGWQILDDMGCRVKVVNIPEGKDPDEFIRNHGAEKFMQVLRENVLNLCDYMTDRAMEKYDIYTLEGKFKIASEVIPSIKNLSNEIEKDEAIMKLARRLHLSPEAIRLEVEKNAGNIANSGRNRDKIAGLRNNNTEFVKLSKKAIDTSDARSRAEKVLLTLALENKNYFLEIKRQIGTDFASSEEYSQIINLLNEMIEKELDYRPAALFDRLAGSPAAEVLSMIMVVQQPVKDKSRLLKDCLNTIKEDELKKKREDLLRQMENADKNKDHDLRKKLLLEYSKLI